MKQTMQLIAIVLLFFLVACSEKERSTMNSEKTSNVIALSASSVTSAVSEVYAQSGVTVTLSNQTAAGTNSNQEYVGVKHDINDSATSINGYFYKEYWGNWISRTSGKKYMIGIAKLPNEQNPGAIFLDEVKEIRPGEPGTGIERIATIRAVALVNKSSNFLSVNGDYCLPNERSRWSPNYTIIAVLSPMLEKKAREEIYGGSGIAAVAHQAWFLDVDNEKLIPLSEEERGQIVCMDRKW
ncbi:MAG: hypothetical protein WAW02_09370 [Sideroxyarcus sp.]